MAAEPGGQRQLGVLEHRAGGQPDLLLAAVALEQLAGLQRAEAAVAAGRAGEAHCSPQPGSLTGLGRARRSRRRFRLPRKAVCEATLAWPHPPRSPPFPGPRVAMPIAALLARIEGLVARVAALEAENAALKARVGMLEAENAALKADNAALGERLGPPPRRRTIPSTPPSQGHKANGAAGRGRRARPTRGAPPLHPDPTRRREVSGGSLPALPGGADGGEPEPLQAYDRIDIPRDHAGRHPGDAVRRHLPPAATGGSRPAPRRAGAGLAVRAEPARLRPLPALRPGDPVRAAGAAAVRPVRAGDQRRRAGQHAGGQRPGVRGPGERHPPPPAVRHRPAIGRDLRAGRQADLLDLGLPSRRQRLLRHPSLARQGGGRGVPRRRPARLLGLRPPRGADGLGGQGASGLSRPPAARHPVRHRRR